MPAWDGTRTPEKAVIEDCVHCGFCLPTCPTHSLWAEEMDSPRGRIVLIDAGLDADSSLSDATVTHLDRCLGCMACVSACPSGVRYDELLVDTRAQVERRWRRPLGERIFRRLVFALFPHPGRMRALAPALSAARVLGIQRAAARTLFRDGRPSPGAPPASRRGRLRSLVALTPPRPLRSALRRLPEHTPAAGESRGRVAVLQGCVQRACFPDVNEATVAVLAAEGFDVHAPPEPGCCGSLELHAGEPSAVGRAKRTIAALEGFEYVVANSAGCGSGMKDYGHLLREEPDWAGRAASFAAKVRDVSELLAESGSVAVRHPLRVRVAYHDACHLAHAQGVRAQPRRLLREIPGLELVEPERWEICCGSAGVYNLLQPRAAADLGRLKAECLIATGAELVAAANPGCALQIELHSRLAGTPLRVLHPVQLLRASIEGGRL